MNANKEPILSTVKCLGAYGNSYMRTRELEAIKRFVEEVKQRATEPSLDRRAQLEHIMHQVLRELEK